MKCKNIEFIYIVVFIYMYKKWKYSFWRINDNEYKFNVLVIRMFKKNEIDILYLYFKD